MAEKTRYQTWLDSLTPKEEAERKALMELSDQEYMAELQNDLPPELRFGGEFGGISALGYGDGGDDRAQIRSYTTSNGGLPSILGLYLPSERRLGQLTNKQARTNAITESDIVDYIIGPPDYEVENTTEGRSKGISVFSPTGKLGAGGKYGSKEGYMPEYEPLTRRYEEPLRYTYAQTVQHELQHRGFDHPAFLDFLEETEETENGRPLKAREEHRFIEASPDFERKHNDQELYRKMLSRFEEWLTPEKQEKYGIRVPVKASVPTKTSVLDDLINFIRGQ